MNLPATSSTDTVILTAEGRRRLQARLDAALEQLADVEQNLPRAEDRAELIEERLRLQDRIATLRQALSRSVAVDAVIEDPTVVELGDEVEIEYEDGDHARFVLVHPVEVDADRGHISVQSPLAQALLGCGVGDEVQVTAPAGSYRARIVDRRRSA